MAGFCYHSSMKEITVVILFMVLVLAIGQKVVLHIAIVEMVVKSKYDGGSCQELINSSVFITNIGDVHYNWSEVQQAFMLFSYHLGIMITLLPAAQICFKFGTRRPFLIGFTLSSICTLIIPPIVKYVFPGGLIVCRIIIGMGHGILFPGINALLQFWIPFGERRKLGIFVGLSQPVAVSVAILLSGSVISYCNGWSAGFYFWGLFGLLVMMLFAIYVYSEPTDNPLINVIELDLLRKGVKTKAIRPLPWKKVITDSALWGLTIGLTGHKYVWYMVLTYLPKYIDNVLHYNFDETSILYAAPFVFELFGSITSEIMNYFIMKRTSRPFLVRKVLTLVSGVVPGIFYVTVTSLGCRRQLVILNFCFGLFFSGFVNCGLDATILEYTNNYTCKILAVCNGIASLSIVGCTVVISLILKKSVIEEWRIIFWTLLGVALVTTIICTVLGPREHAHWDYVDEIVSTKSKGEVKKHVSRLNWVEKPSFIDNSGDEDSQSKPGKSSKPESKRAINFA